MKASLIITWGMTVAASTALCQITITQQPMSQSVSLRANVIFSVSASGTTPLTYQWRFSAIDIPSATNSSLTLTNVQLTDAGVYNVLVTNPSGSITSKVVGLDVDPAFTKITTGDIVSDRGEYFNCSWADFDNDGYLDL